MTDAATEQEIQAKGLTAPRVTLAEIEQNIVGEYCFTAQDGIVGVSTTRKIGVPTHESLGLLTICVLVLKNGFTVVGTSACASPENFDAELGGKIARKAAVEQMWPLMGYELRSRLANFK
jgi:hypothetical protein